MREETGEQSGWEVGKGGGGWHGGNRKQLENPVKNTAFLHGHISGSKLWLSNGRGSLLSNAN